jgi:hypothetical protein
MEVKFLNPFLPFCFVIGAAVALAVKNAATSTPMAKCLFIQLVLANRAR